MTDLQEVIEGKVAQGFRSGRVEKIRGDVGGSSIMLADGWISRLLWRGNIRDVYIVFAKPEHVLPLHSHPQVEHIYCVSGECFAEIEGLDGEMNTHHFLPGDGLIIDGNMKHEFTASGQGDCILLVAFEPPLSH